MTRVDPYTSYREYCIRIGVEPMEEETWREKSDKIRPVTMPASPMHAHPRLPGTYQ